MFWIYMLAGIGAFVLLLLVIAVILSFVLLLPGRPEKKAQREERDEGSVDPPFEDFKE